MRIHQKQTVIVGLSGGVDSALSALLLKEAGYDVQGLFMKNWEEDDTPGYCSAQKDHQDAKTMANQLNIPLHTANFSQEYWEKVFSFFLDEYRAGKTPNPDILCNKEIKFKAFLEHATQLGADLIATGHYAQRGTDTASFMLKKGADQNKDQTYFIYAMGQTALSRTLFPIGHLEKPDVRIKAKEANLISHNKKDSTGICFIGERKFKTFLEDFLLAQPGKMMTPEGRHLGTHDGIMFYTLGQRHGLKIGGVKNGLEKPWYVVGKDIKDNILFVTQAQDHAWHYSKKLMADQCQWITQPPEINKQVKAKVRYRQSENACKIIAMQNDEIIVEFEENQKAVTPGQSIVFYDNEYCLGGATIQSTDSVGGILQSKLLI